jgi:hypothetical protein
VRENRAAANTASAATALVNKEAQMSLAIIVNKVVKVLLADGKWHQVRQ